MEDFLFTDDDLEADDLARLGLRLYEKAPSRSTAPRGRVGVDGVRGGETCLRWGLLRSMWIGLVIKQVHKKLGGV